MKALISETLIKRLKPEAKPYEVRDERLPGFTLRVQPSGYMCYYAVYGRGKRVKVGPASKLTALKARDAAKKLISGATLGEDPAAKRKAEKAATLAEYLDNIYEPWALSHLKSGAIQVQRIRSRFAHLLNKKLGDITPWIIEKYRSRRLKEVSTRTVNRDCQALRAALRRAADWNIIPDHPLAKLKSLREDASPRVRYLSDEEEERLRAALDRREEKLRRGRDRGNAWRRERGYKQMADLRAAPFADRMRPLVILALNSGLRRGELFNLQWRDVDLVRATLTVGGAGAKTGQTRHVPLNSEALQTLIDWRSQGDGNGLVFPGADGARLDNVNKSWRSLMRAAKITGFRWHDLRHSFASRLAMCGCDLNTIRELLGHGSLAMTTRYAHLQPQKKAQAVEMIVSRTPKAKAVQRD